MKGREFYKKLPADLKKKFKAGCKKAESHPLYKAFYKMGMNQGRFEGLMDCDISSMSELINCAFPWDYTDEGKDFWREVRERYKSEENSFTNNINEL